MGALRSAAILGGPRFSAVPTRRRKLSRLRLYSVVRRACSLLFSIIVSLLYAFSFHRSTDRPISTMPVALPGPAYKSSRCYEDRTTQFCPSLLMRDSRQLCALIDYCDRAQHSSYINIYRKICTLVIHLDFLVSRSVCTLMQGQLSANDL